MNSLKAYITEKFQVPKDYKRKHIYNYHPKSKGELLDLVNELIKERGNEADLNDIDTSNITDMSYMFTFARSDFNGNISEWDVSNVTSMKWMFTDSMFTGENGDISDWDVSKVEDMESMFERSMYNGDISDWDVSNVRNMVNMFFNSKFTGENGSLDRWNVKKLQKADTIFYLTPLEKNLPKWYNDWYKKLFNGKISSI